MRSTLFWGRGVLTIFTIFKGHHTIFSVLGGRGLGSNSGIFRGVKAISYLEGVIMKLTEMPIKWFKIDLNHQFSLFFAYI